MKRVDLLLQRRDVLRSLIQHCQDPVRRASLMRSLRELEDVIAERTPMVDHLSRFAAR